MYEARNTSSDIWSLGCVFLEMTAALQGLNVEWIKKFYIKCHSQGTHFHANPAATTQLIQEFGTTAHPKHKRTLSWIEQMIRVDRTARPTAAQVLEMITVPEESDVDATPNTFCGICCVPDLESDSSDSLVDDFDTITAALPSSHLRKDTITQRNSGRPKAAAPSPFFKWAAGANNRSNSKPNGKPLSADRTPEIDDASITSSKAGDGETLADSNTNPNAEVLRSPGLAPKTESDATISATSNPNVVGAMSKASFDDRGDSDFEEYKRTVADARKVGMGGSETPDSSDRTTALIHSSNNERDMASAPSENVNSTSKSCYPFALSLANSIQGAHWTEQKTFGVPLEISIQYAYWNLTQYKTVGGSLLNGPIPCVVARCGSFMKRNCK